MPPVGSAGPLLIWLSAELPGSPLEPSSVSEPDAESDLPPPTWTEPEASSGPVQTGTVGAQFAGTWIGSGLVLRDFVETDGGLIQFWWFSETLLANKQTQEAPPVFHFSNYVLIQSMCTRFLAVIDVTLQYFTVLRGTLMYSPSAASSSQSSNVPSPKAPHWPLQLCDCDWLQTVGDFLHLAGLLWKRWDHLWMKDEEQSWELLIECGGFHIYCQCSLNEPAEASIKYSNGKPFHSAFLTTVLGVVCQQRALFNLSLS